MKIPENVNMLYTNGRGKFIIRQIIFEKTLPTGYKLYDGPTRTILQSVTNDGTQISTVFFFKGLPFASVQERDFYETLISFPNGQTDLCRYFKKKTAIRSHKKLEKRYGGKLKRQRGHAALYKHFLRNFKPA